MDGGAWWAAVHEVTKSRTRLSNFTFTFAFHALEKEMATHSSVLAWRIPGRASLVGCHLWGRKESDTLSLCLFNLYAEYIMRNTGLEEAQAGIKIARRNINNLRYADDTTLMAESQEELKSFLKVKEECEKVGLKLNTQKTKIMASGPITSWQIDGETGETVLDFISPFSLSPLATTGSSQLTLVMDFTTHLEEKEQTGIAERRQTF